MRVSPDQLARHFSKVLAPLYTVFGEDQLLAIEAADLIRSTARKAGYMEREIFSIDHQFNWAELEQCSSSLSLFGERRIIDMRIPSGKPGIKGSATIEEYCHALPPDTVTLVTLPKIDKKTSAAKWFKALEDAGVTVPVYPVERSRLPSWISQRLGKQNQSAEPDALRFIAEKVEGNLLAAHQEIKKLGLLYPPRTLSLSEVKEAVLDVARYDVFKLADAMLSGSTSRYARILQELQGEGAPLPLIVSTLAARIRPLDSDQVVDALLHLAKIDRISKGAALGNAWDELLQLGLRFSAIIGK